MERNQRFVKSALEENLNQFFKKQSNSSREDFGQTSREEPRGSKVAHYKADNKYGRSVSSSEFSNTYGEATRGSREEVPIYFRRGDNQSETSTSRYGKRNNDDSDKSLYARRNNNTVEDRYGSRGNDDRYGSRGKVGNSSSTNYGRSANDNSLRNSDFYKNDSNARIRDISSDYSRNNKSQDRNCNAASTDRFENYDDNRNAGDHYDINCDPRNDDDNYVRNNIGPSSSNVSNYRIIGLNNMDYSKRDDYTAESDFSNDLKNNDRSTNNYRPENNDRFDLFRNNDHPESNYNLGRNQQNLNNGDYGSGKNARFDLTRNNEHPEINYRFGRNHQNINNDSTISEFRSGNTDRFDQTQSNYNSGNHQHFNNDRFDQARYNAYPESNYNTDNNYFGGNQQTFHTNINEMTTPAFNISNRKRQNSSQDRGDFKKSARIGNIGVSSNAKTNNVAVTLPSTSPNDPTSGGKGKNKKKKDIRHSNRRINASIRNKNENRMRAAAGESQNIVKGKSKPDPEKYWRAWWSKHAYIEKSLPVFDDDDLKSLEPKIKFVHTPGDSMFADRKRVLLRMGVSKINRNLNITESNYKARDVIKLFMYKKQLEDPNFQQHLNQDELKSVTNALNSARGKVKLALLLQSIIYKWHSFTEIVKRKNNGENIPGRHAENSLNDKLFNYLVWDCIQELKELCSNEWPGFDEFYNSL